MMTWFSENHDLAKPWTTITRKKQTNPEDRVIHLNPPHGNAMASDNLSAQLSLRNLCGTLVLGFDIEGHKWSKFTPSKENQTVLVHGSHGLPKPHLSDVHRCRQLRQSPPASRVHRPPASTGLISSSSRGRAWLLARSASASALALTRSASASAAALIRVASASRALGGGERRHRGKLQTECGGRTRTINCGKSFPADETRETRGGRGN